MTHIETAKLLRVFVLLAIIACVAIGLPIAIVYVAALASLTSRQFRGLTLSFAALCVLSYAVQWLFGVASDLCKFIKQLEVEA